jgi:hypothetical protein
MTMPWLTLFGIVAIGVFYVLMPIFMGVYTRYRRTRWIRCPETAGPAKIGVDAFHAAVTAIPGPPHVRVVECSLWPERAGCAQSCVTAHS